MITIAFVVITCVISYMAFTREELIVKLAHHPYSESSRGQYYRMLTAGFVHGSWGHLFINMYVLYQFGAITEGVFGQIFGTVFGQLMFMIFYISAIVIANLGTYFKHKTNPGFRSVGASGVTSALVLIYVLFAPWEMFIFPPIPAILFAVLYLGYSTWASNNSRDNVDHMAHLFGGVYGVLFLFITYPDVISLFTRRFMAGWPL